jgi:hypothetical protein
LISLVGLEDMVIKLGWKNVGKNSADIKEASVLLVDGSDGTNTLSTIVF